MQDLDMTAHMKLGPKQNKSTLEWFIDNYFILQTRIILYTQLAQQAHPGLGQGVAVVPVVVCLCCSATSRK